jgi:hypothetical protein
MATIEDYVFLINKKRKAFNALPIEINRRPGSKNPKVETIEIRSVHPDNPNIITIYFKSQNWGNINVFLRGMLSGFVNEAVPMISSVRMDTATHRRLEL